PRRERTYRDISRSRLHDQFVLDYHVSMRYIAHILAHLRGRLPETRRRRSGEWRPAAAARNRAAPGGPGHRPPGTTTWLRGARSTDPEEMPVKEAPGPKSPRWSAERRARPAGRAPRLARRGRSRVTSATT